MATTLIAVFFVPRNRYPTRTSLPATKARAKEIDGPRSEVVFVKSKVLTLSAIDSCKNSALAKDEINQYKKEKVHGK
eukprot:scaffold14974_cov195-Amphora_coffeaeformis.AAC.59